MQKILAGVALLLTVVCVSRVQAGQIRMTGVPVLTLKAIPQGILLEGSYTLTNSGDERAKNVYPKILIDSFEVTGSPTELDPQGKSTWNFREEIPRDKLSVLPIAGQFLIRIENHYSDLNNYPFVIPQLKVISLNGESSVGQTEMALKIKKVDENIYQADYEVHNKLMDDMNLQISAVLPQEVQLITGITPIFLKEQASLFASFQFKNTRGLQGSRYYAYLAVQWENSGKRYISWTSAPFAIGVQEAPPAVIKGNLVALPKEKIFWGIWCLVAFFGSFLLLRFWMQPLQDMQKKK